ncbi:hypothetical protein RJT34_31802 [Clitoria ternatea]|uniref:Uncharacterized protein n=1 Tax=Clitoria ternatea TaxID=43366 RepID=A0AAN9EUV2_CLITE
MQEIAKGFRAEEWGLVDDALLHYKNAHAIFIKANSTPVSLVSQLELGYGCGYLKDYYYEAYDNITGISLDYITMRLATTTCRPNPSTKNSFFFPFLYHTENHSLFPFSVSS